jgi:hypothetical protein
MKSNHRYMLMAMTAAGALIAGAVAAQSPYPAPPPAPAQGGFGGGGGANATPPARTAAGPSEPKDFLDAEKAAAQVQGQRAIDAANASQEAMGYRPQSVVGGVQIQTPYFQDTLAVRDNMPASFATVPAKKPRKVFVFAKASGYGHSVVPLAAYTTKALGDKTGAWTTTVSYDLKDFTAANLAQYDAIQLDSTTGRFLDDADAAATAARKQALLDFVRSGKGLIMTHAAGDAYHGNGAAAESLWPEFSKMTGGFFKFHWVIPQEITVKVDDAKSPLLAGYGAAPFTVHDEIYTFKQDQYNNRKNFHVLLSVDYSKMSQEDKLEEPESNRRTDGDYVVSWIRKEGQGRVWYNILGHSEHVLSMPAYQKMLVSGIQYAVGDLAADDSPSEK